MCRDTDAAARGEAQPSGGLESTGVLKDSLKVSELAAQAVAQPAAKVSKPRIDCIDGCRFALVLPIIVGHFAKFGFKNEFILKLLTQENVLVGGFFVISGYVTAYVNTKLRELGHDRKKLANPELFFWQKVMSYYPLHFVVSTIFSPMFIMSDVWQKMSSGTMGVNASLNYTLLQAWFPTKAEIWNPPTWFLSALTFCNLLMPSMVLPYVSQLSKDGLRKLLFGLSALSIMQKVSYSAAWQYTCRGNYICRSQPTHLWNMTRFHPIWALVEVTMGIAAARGVMLDGEEQRSRRRTNPLIYFIASHATLLLRTSRANLNDALTRSTLFVPLYLKFITTMHRDCLSDSPALITRFFGSRIMARLGSLAFPMFILHGPMGQLFYKKAVATRLWGRVMPQSFFPIYLLLVLLAGHIANEGFVKSKSVQRVSSRIVRWLEARSEGMLQDFALPLNLQQGL